MRRLDVYRHLTNVVLHVWIIDLVLRGDIFESVVVGSLGRTQKRCGIMRYETRLPSLFKILSGVTNQVSVRNERLMEAHQMTCCTSHSNRIPPGGVYLHSRIGEIAGHH